jgi:hypothetical protein
MEFGEVDGFGNGSSGDVEELNKALAAGYETDSVSLTGGDAIRVQSLESTLRVLTETEKHMVFWNRIFKNPAYSTVEEYSQLNSIGSSNPGFLPAGVLPEEDDADLSRKTSLVKYIGTTRSVQHPMMLINTIAGAKAVEVQIKTGTLKIMRDAEFGLFWGNSKLCYDSTSNEGVEFDGLNTLIDITGDVDLNNHNPAEADFGIATEIVFSNFGFANAAYMSPMVAKIAGDTILPKERVQVGATDKGITAGLQLSAVKTQFGTVDLLPDIFLSGKYGRNPKVPAPAATTSTKAPTTPASVTPSSMTGADGKFHACQIGEIKFAVTACNRYGESAPTALSTGISPTSSDMLKHIPLTIANAASVVVAPEYFNIYATEVGGTVAYYVGSVAAGSQSNNGTTTYSYTGLLIANTSIAFIGDDTPDVVGFKQLAPLMKMDLATIAPSYRFMLLLYGVMQLYAKKKFIRLINIKDY